MEKEGKFRSAEGYAALAADSLPNPRQFKPAAARHFTINPIGRFAALRAGNLPMEKEGKFRSAEGYAALAKDALHRSPPGYMLLHIIV